MASWKGPILAVVIAASAGPVVASAGPGVGSPVQGAERPSAPAPAPPRYVFERTFARHEGPPELPSRLTVLTAAGPVEHEFAPGAEIWRDESDHGYLIVRFIDRRFSAFATSGLDHVDLDTGKRIPLLRGLVFQAEGVPEDLMVGVRRVPKESRPLGHRLAGELYHDGTFELFMLFFDPPHRRWHLVPVRTAPWLPDGNQPWPPGQPPPELVYVEGGVLFVATDPSGKTFERYRLEELVPW